MPEGLLSLIERARPGLQVAVAFWALGVLGYHYYDQGYHLLVAHLLGLQP